MSAPTNIFIFGLQAEEVRERSRRGFDSSRDDRRLAGAAPRRSRRSPPAPSRRSEPSRYAPIVDALYHHDRFMVTADFDAYYATQRRVDALWRDQPAWWATSIRNTAQHGLVLLRPGHPRICGGHLGCSGRPRCLTRRRPSVTHRLVTIVQPFRLCHSRTSKSGGLAACSKRGGTFGCSGAICDFAQERCRRGVGAIIFGLVREYQMPAPFPRIDTVRNAILCRVPGGPS